MTIATTITISGGHKHESYDKDKNNDDDENNNDDVKNNNDRNKNQNNDNDNGNDNENGNDNDNGNDKEQRPQHRQPKHRTTGSEITINLHFETSIALSFIVFLLLATY